MTVTRTEKVKVVGEVVAIEELVLSGEDVMFLGTNRGGLYKYNVPDGTVTLIENLGSKVNCLLYDASTYMYIGLDNGKLLKYTVADETLATLYNESDRAILSLSIYSTTLSVSMSGGMVTTVTTS